MSKKKNYDEKYMSIAKDCAVKSKCSRLTVGAAIVKNGKLISSGYNGVPKNLKNCSAENPCFKQINNIPSGTPVDAIRCMSVHAEVFAIINATRESKESLSGATLYTTHAPCQNCALLIIAADIRRVIYEKDYPDKVGIEILKQAKVIVEKYDPQQTNQSEQICVNRSKINDPLSLITKREVEAHA